MVLILLFGIVFGCSKDETDSIVDIPVSQMSEHDNHAVLDVLVESIDDLNTYTSINFHTIDHQYTLVELVQNMMEGQNYLVDHTEVGYTNSRFVLVDLEKREIQEILWAWAGLVDAVRLQGDQIIFSYTGSNTRNAFKIFPYHHVFDLTDRVLKDEPIYRDLHHSTRVGGYTNSLDLGSIIANDDHSITFTFTENQQTIIAGGEIFPTVQMGMIEDEFYFDMLNIHLSTETEQLLSSFEAEMIETVRTKVYIDERDHDHLVVYLKLKGVQQYRCELEAWSSPSKLTIIFR